MAPRLLPATVLSVSILLLIAIPVFVWQGSGAPASVGVRPPSEVSEQGSVARAPLSAGPEVERIGTPVRAAEASTGTAPVQVRIDRIRVEAPIDPVGVMPDGGVEIPEDVSRVGWYRFGAAPGESAGSVVLVGHRDGVSEGAGALYYLEALEPGDVIDVVGSSGEEHSYSVVSREVFDKDEMPLDELFSEQGDERLTLISCIGYYSRDNGGYQQNIVVTAVPVSSGAQGPV